MLRQPSPLPAQPSREPVISGVLSFARPTGSPLRTAHPAGKIINSCIHAEGVRNEVPAHPLQTLRRPPGDQHQCRRRESPPAGAVTEGRHHRSHGHSPGHTGRRREKTSPKGAFLPTERRDSSSVTTPTPDDPAAWNETLYDKVELKHIVRLMSRPLFGNHRQTAAAKWADWARCASGSKADEMMTDRR